MGRILGSLRDRESMGGPHVHGKEDKQIYKMRERISGPGIQWTLRMRKEGRPQ